MRRAVARSRAAMARGTSARSWVIWSVTRFPKSPSRPRPRPPRLPPLPTERAAAADLVPFRRAGSPSGSLAHAFGCRGRIGPIGSSRVTQFAECHPPHLRQLAVGGIAGSRYPVRGDRARFTSRAPASSSSGAPLPDRHDRAGRPSRNDLGRDRRRARHVAASPRAPPHISPRCGRSRTHAGCAGTRARSSRASRRSS
jgi:hypothetical protein